MAKLSVPKWRYSATAALNEAKRVEALRRLLAPDLTPAGSNIESPPCSASLLSCRPNLNTAANPTSPWLFPARSAGSHLRPSTLRAKVMEIGIDLLAARNAALRHLVLDCPPPVVADTLGYSYQTIDRHAIRAGSPWSS